MFKKIDELVKTIKEFHRKGKTPYVSQLFWSTSLAPATIDRYLRHLEREGVVEIIECKGRKYVRLKGDLYG